MQNDTEWTWSPVMSSLSSFPSAPSSLNSLLRIVIPTDQDSMNNIAFSIKSKPKPYGFLYPLAFFSWSIRSCLSNPWSLFARHPIKTENGVEIIGQSKWRSLSCTSNCSLAWASFGPLRSFLAWPTSTLTLVFGGSLTFWTCPKDFTSFLFSFVNAEFYVWFVEAIHMELSRKWCLWRQWKEKPLMTRLLKTNVTCTAFFKDWLLLSIPCCGINILPAHICTKGLFLNPHHIFISIIKLHDSDRLWQTLHDKTDGWKEWMHHDGYSTYIILSCLPLLYTPVLVFLRK